MTEQTTEQQLFQQVQSVIRGWRAGAPPNAREAIDHIPGIDGYPSLLIDLAYEQYCLEEAAGSLPGVSVYCAQFGSIQSQLRDVLEGHKVLLTNPQLLQTVVWPAAGESWDRIHFRRELGRGAFARAYLVEDASINRPVVLKLSHRDSAEGLSLGTLQHAHIVNILWSREMNGFHVVAMPYEGSSTLLAILDLLRARLTRSLKSQAILSVATRGEPAPGGQPPLLTGKESYVDAIAMMAERVALALHYAQGQGISHGDLKPANILVGPTGHPYLIDFNLASDANRSRAVLGGTLPYMAPERLASIQQGATHIPATESSDVYSFGVVLFEALTGHLPFGRGECESSHQAVTAELFRRKEATLKRPPDMPRPLFRLIRDCLLADVGRRPSFREAARRLGRSRNRGRRLIIAIAGVTATALVAGGVLALAHWPESKPEAAARAQPATADEYIARARRFLKTGDPASAVADYRRAIELREDGRTLAELAYALSLTGQEGPASASYQEAVGKHNYREPWVLNNIAAGLVRNTEIPAVMEEALKLTNEVLQRQPSAREARYNQALAEFALDLDAKLLQLRDRRSIDDIKGVLKSEPCTGKLYLDAAIMHTCGNTADVEQAVKLAGEAIRHGHKYQSLLANPLLKRLGTRPDFQKLEQLKTGPSDRDVASLRLMTPPVE